MPPAAGCWTRVRRDGPSTGLKEQTRLHPWAADPRVGTACCRAFAVEIQGPAEQFPGTAEQFAGIAVQIAGISPANPSPANCKAFPAICRAVPANYSAVPAICTAVPRTCWVSPSGARCRSSDEKGHCRRNRLGFPCERRQLAGESDS